MSIEKLPLCWQESEHDTRDEGKERISLLDMLADEAEYHYREAYELGQEMKRMTLRYLQYRRGEGTAGGIS